MSLCTKLLLMLGTLMAASLLAILLTLQHWQQAIERQLLVDAELALRKRSEFLLNSVTNARQTLRILARSGMLSSGRPEDIRDSLHILNSSPSRFESFYYDALGGEVYQSDGTTFSIRDRAYFPQIQQGVPVSGVTLTSRATGKPVLLLTVPLHNRSGTLIGALAATLRLSDLLGVVVNEAPGTNAGLMILDAEGNLLAGDMANKTRLESAQELRHNTSPARAGHALSSLTAALSGKTVATAIVSINDERFRAFAARVADLGWLIVYIQPEAALMASLSDTRRQAWGVLLSLMLLAAVLAYLVERHVLKPLQIIRDAQSRVQDGDLGTRALVHGHDELAELAQSFNRMVDSLEAAEQRFRIVFETFPHPIVLNRLTDNRFIDVNPAFARQCGLERSEIVGRTLQELGFSFDTASTHSQLAELKTRGHLDGITLQTLSESGEPRWVIYSSRLIEVDGEQLALSVTTDITELKVAEAALKESETSFMALFQMAPVPLSFIEESDGFKATRWNDAWYQTFGFSKEEADGHSGNDFGLWLTATERESYIATATAEGRVDGLETRLLRKDGAHRNCIIKGHLMHTGERRFLITAYLDVTEIRRAEQEIRARESTLQALFNASPVAMSVSDRAHEHAVIAVNAAWQRQFRRQAPQTTGQADQQTDLWANQEERQNIIDRIEATGSVSGFEAEFIRGDGVRILCRVAAQCFAAGEASLLVMVHEDITDQRQAEQAMHDLNQQLAAQNSLTETIARAQSGFIVNADIRQVFDALLSDLLKLTRSEYGFIGEVLYTADGAPYLKAHTLTNIAWNEQTRRFYDQHAPEGLEFRNLKTLFGVALTSGEPVIANAPASDPRSGGLPPGHPPMHAFLGIPIHIGEKLVAMAGLANRPGGYDRQMLNWLHPLMTTAGQMIEARRGESARHLAEVAAQRYRYMVDHANDAIFLMDGLVIVECNPAALKTFGCERDEFIGHTPIDFSPERQADGTHSLERAKHYVQKVIDGSALRFEWLHCRADRSEFIAEVELGSFDEGPKKHVMAVLRDITERKRIVTEISTLNATLEERVAHRTRELASRNTELAEAMDTLERARASLARNEYRLRGVMAATGEGFWDWQIATDRLYTSTRWCEILGFSPYDNDHAFDFFTALILDEEKESVLHAIRQCLNGEGPFHHEHRVRRRDGSLLWVQNRADVAERSAEGVPLRMIGSISNISARKQTELALAEAKTQAETTNSELASTLDNLRRAQDELVRTEKLASLGALVAGVAHELNTPIGNAVTVSSTLIDEQKQFARIAREGLTRSALTTFIEAVGEAGEILDRNLSRAAELVGSFKQLAVDQSSYQRRTFDLQDVVHEIALAMGPAVRKKRCTVHYEVQPGLHLDSYPGPMGQVLMNLINNALIHAFDGKEDEAAAAGTYGTIHVAARESGPGWINLSVSDDGQGISAENQKRIFDPFFTTRLGQGGSGLGLHIVFNLVTELLGGRIDVTSSPTTGTLFLVRIPNQAPPARTLEKQGMA